MLGSGNKPSIGQSQTISLKDAHYNQNPIVQQTPLRDSIFQGKATPQQGNLNKSVNMSQFQDPRVSTQLQQQQQLGQQVYQQQQFIAPEQLLQQRLSTVVKIDPRVKQSVGPGSMLQTQPGVPYFYNKRVVVTGASSGVGRAVAIW